MDNFHQPTSIISRRSPGMQFGLSSHRVVSRTNRAGSQEVPRVRPADRRDGESFATARSIGKLKDLNLFCGDEGSSGVCGFLASIEVGKLNRFVLALRAFWRILTESDFAARVEPLFTKTPTGPGPEGPGGLAA